MENFTAEVSWERGSQDFLDKKYSRRHVWRFDSGVEVPASSSPLMVRPPLSDVSAVDPEEAFVAALSSCHMLWFLAIAAKNGFRIDQYHDAVSGVMSKDDNKRLFVAQVTLHPQAVFSGDVKPTWQQVIDMHDEAHHECNIANSVKSEVCCEPVPMDN